MVSLLLNGGNKDMRPSAVWNASAKLSAFAEFRKAYGKLILTLGVSNVDVEDVQVVISLLYIVIS